MTESAAVCPYVPSPGNDWRWSGGQSPGPNSRLVVVAPHPDDEVLATAGLMRWAVDAGAAVEIVAVTDGEASHRASTRIGPADLVRRRAAERRNALYCLGLGFLPVHQLGFPDGAVAHHVGDLARSLADLLAQRDGTDTTVVVPWEYDGHPDHEAVAQAGLRAAHRAGSTCWQVPIWSLVSGRFNTCGAEALGLGAYSAVKAAAARCFRTQLIALGPDPEDGPVVRLEELEVLTGDVEFVVTGNPG